MRRNPAGVAVLGVVLVAIVAWGVAFASPLFHVRTVLVRGNVRLSMAEVTELTGDLHGRNLLTLSLEGVRGSVLESPWIARATVTRSLPGGIQIEVEERLPTAWAAGEAGGAIVASDGVVLEHRARRPAGLPTIGEVLALPLPGERLDAAEIGVLAALSPAVRREVARAEARGDSVSLRLRAGGEVIYGPPDLIGEKNAVLESLLAWTRERGIEIDYIDVRAPSTPTVKPVGEPAGPTLDPHSSV